MEKIYRVFVSSTYEDLREERAEVQKVLLKLKCFPVGMELFPSTDDETWEFIKRQISDSDYYVLIVAGRYGSLASDGLSFTEKEYDYAREIGKPRLSFVHGDRGAIASSNTEQDAEKRKKLEEFITKVRSGPLVQAFTTPHELSGQVLVSMVDLRDRKPGIGFVRADQIVDAKKYADLLEENGRLKSDMARLTEKESAFPGCGDVLFLQIDSKVPYGTKDNTVKPVTVEVNITLRDIFMHVANAIILCPEIDDHAMARIVAGKTSGHEPSVLIFYFRNNEIENVKKILFAKHLVSFTSHTGMSDAISCGRFHTWDMTEYGRKQYSLIFEGLPKVDIMYIR